jgi:hypothetical protein
MLVGVDVSLGVGEGGVIARDRVYWTNRRSTPLPGCAMANATISLIHRDRKATVARFIGAVK